MTAYTPPILYLLQLAAGYLVLRWILQKATRQKIDKHNRTFETATRFGLINAIILFVLAMLDIVSSDMHRGWIYALGLTFGPIYILISSFIIYVLSFFFPKLIPKNTLICVILFPLIFYLLFSALNEVYRRLS